MRPVDEYGALIYAGRWGIHGVSLPGRVTFSPGNIGFATFGAPRPMEVRSKQIKLMEHNNMNNYSFIYLIFPLVLCFMQTQIISDDTWKLVDEIWDKKVKEIKTEAVIQVEEEKKKPQILMATHFF